MNICFYISFSYFIKRLHSFKIYDMKALVSWEFQLHNAEKREENTGRTCCKFLNFYDEPGSGIQISIRNQKNLDTGPQRDLGSFKTYQITLIQCSVHYIKIITNFRPESEIQNIQILYHS